MLENPYVRIQIYVYLLLLLLLLILLVLLSNIETCYTFTMTKQRTSQKKRHIFKFDLREETSMK